MTSTLAGSDDTGASRRLIKELCNIADRLSSLVAGINRNALSAFPINCRWLVSK